MSKLLSFGRSFDKPLNTRRTYRINVYIPRTLLLVKYPGIKFRLERKQAKHSEEPTGCIIRIEGNFSPSFPALKKHFVPSIITAAKRISRFRRGEKKKRKKNRLDHFVLFFKDTTRISPLKGPKGVRWQLNITQRPFYPPLFLPLLMQRYYPGRYIQRNTNLSAVSIITVTPEFKALSLDRKPTVKYS